MSKFIVPPCLTERLSATARVLFLIFKPTIAMHLAQPQVIVTRCYPKPPTFASRLDEDVQISYVGPEAYCHGVCATEEDLIRIITQEELAIVSLNSTEAVEHSSQLANF